jgi:hypothetical protein
VEILEGEALSIKFGYLANSIPFLAKDVDIKALLNEMPSNLKDLLNPVVMKSINLPAKCSEGILTGILIKDLTPTGRPGYYVEVYRGSMLPFTSRPALQCTGNNNGQLIGCRLRDDRPDWLRTVLEYTEKCFSREDSYRIVFVICGGEVIWSSEA